MAGKQPTVTALLPAAGLGERLGRGPKALLRIDELTLLEFCIRALEPLVDHVLVAVPAGFEQEFLQVLPAGQMITGGASRQETVHLLAQAADSEFLLVHDAARPFLPTAVASRVLAAAREQGAATAVVPVVDSLIRRIDGNTVERSELQAVQTPQAFRRDLLLMAHDSAAAESLSATDDAALVRQLGSAVAAVEGSPWLFKITHPADLQLARLVAPAWPAVLEAGAGRGTRQC